MKHKIYLIGDNIQQSLSDKIHNFWINFYKKESIYIKKTLMSHQLNSFFKEIREDLFFLGANVTAPHKKESFLLCDDCFGVASKIKSINALFRRDGKILGYNTDYIGFKKSLKKENISGKNILILGAGGVIPSLLYALYDISEDVFVSILNRNIDKAYQLKESFPFLKILDSHLDEETISCVDYCINGTSIPFVFKESEFFKNFKWDSLKSGSLFYNLSYFQENKMMELWCSERNIRYKSGWDMFIIQAAYTFQLFFGIFPDVTMIPKEFGDFK